MKCIYCQRNSVYHRETMKPTWRCRTCGKKFDDPDIARLARERETAYEKEARLGRERESARLGREMNEARLARERELAPPIYFRGFAREMEACLARERVRFVKKEIETNLAEAQNASSNKDYKKAVRLIDTVLKYDCNNFEALFLRSRIYIHCNRHYKAIADLRNIFKDTNVVGTHFTAEGHFWQGIAYRDLGKKLILRPIHVLLIPPVDAADPSYENYPFGLEENIEGSDRTLISKIFKNINGRPLRCLSEAINSFNESLRMDRTSAKTIYWRGLTRRDLVEYRISHPSHPEIFTIDRCKTRQITDSLKSQSKSDLDLAAALDPNYQSKVDATFNAFEQPSS